MGKGQMKPAATHSIFYMDSSTRTLAPPSITPTPSTPSFHPPVRSDTDAPHTGISARAPVVSGPALVASPLNALLASALFGTWHLLVFYAGWAALITVLNDRGYNLSIQPTLLTAAGTVLGFVISYRTTSAYEKYNQGRTQWARIIHACRTLARVVWFHVPELPVDHDKKSKEEIDMYRGEVIIEKKTVLNLMEAAAVAVKHYLRGEDSINYEDLYYSVYHLDLQSARQPVPMSTKSRTFGEKQSESLPLPVTTPAPTRHRKEDSSATLTQAVELPPFLLPSFNPPTFSFYDFLPAWLGNSLRGSTGKKARRARVRTKLYSHKAYDNIPVEISLYLSSYISHLQRRGGMDVPTMNALFAAVNTFVESLTDLERISTAPVPFSYSSHLWSITTLYCLALPFQLYNSLGWVTIPGTVIVAYFFFGFLVAGEEIENPFGYDINDLNLDNFTHNIIRKEIKSVTARPAPTVQAWVFNDKNLVFTSRKAKWHVRSANEWKVLGYEKMWQVLREGEKDQETEETQSPTKMTPSDTLVPPPANAPPNTGPPNPGKA
ncbi:hypothetical protein AX16_007069 [Volvariella volvacea WC 439]|nr:hypothetical protein AX16_007069 [Volvariella volvacea WC 439]